MNRLKEHYNNVVLYDLITKFNYNNVFEISKILKISLNVGVKNASNINRKKISTLITLLESISGLSSKPTISKKNKIILKIKKGDITGCKITLRNNDLYFFLNKLLLFILPNNKKYKGFFLNKKNKNNFSFNIQNFLNFLELEKEFFKFKDISYINTTLISNSKTNEELKVLLNSFNIPFFK
jgi:large subunit ribosomal protein L5